MPPLPPLVLHYVLQPCRHQHKGRVTVLEGPDNSRPPPDLAGGTPAPLEEPGDVLDPPGRDAREVHLDDGLLVEQRVERLLDGLLHQILKSLRSDSSSTDTMFADAVHASAECEGTYCPLHLASIHVTRTRGAMDNSSEHARASLNLIRCSPLDSSFGFTTVLSRSWMSSAPSALARLPWRARRGKCTG